jgi:hypothetical protein
MHSDISLSKEQLQLQERRETHTHIYLSNYDITLFIHTRERRTHKTGGRKEEEEEEENELESAGQVQRPTDVPFFSSCCQRKIA